MLLLTGGTGFIGQHLAARLLSLGRPVRVLARHGADLPGVEVQAGDVTDLDSVTAAARGCEAIIHLVGIRRETPGQTFVGVHVRGTRNVLAAGRAAGVSRLLHMSALGARPNGASEYHRTKWAAEELVRASGLAATIFRPSLLFNGGAGFFAVLRGLVTLPLPFVPVVGAGDSLFQPIWVEDVITCFVRALDLPETIGQTYDLGGPESYRFRDLVDLVAAAEGVRKPQLHLPVPLLHSAAATLGRLLPRFPVTTEELAMLQEDNVCDIGPMTRAFGITPVSLREHLGERAEAA